MKDWWKSRTFWLGITQLVVALLLYFQEWLQTTTEETSLALLISGLLMIFMRWLTDKPISSPTPNLDSLRPNIRRLKESGAYGHDARTK